MPESIRPKRLTSSQRARLLAAALASAVLTAGCGGSSPRPTTTTAGGATTPASTAQSAGHATTAGSSAPTGEGATSSDSTAPGAYGSGPLAFAKCMRANGVPNFPDPTSDSGGFISSTSGINPAAPAVQAATARCHKFLTTPPNAGGPRGSAQEKAQALAKLRKVAVCMRKHGISDFPDPTATRPSNPFASVPGILTDYDGAFLFLPASIDTPSPAYTQAVAACGPLAESFNHPH
jgi:hypothetical protein